MNSLPLIAVACVVFVTCAVFFVVKKIRDLEIENSRLENENSDYRNNVEFLAAARTQQLKQTKANLEHASDNILKSISDALDCKEAIDGHSCRVAAFTIAIAKRMGLPKDQILVIARGAYLHDFGKTRIRDDILKKPDQLTKDEYQQMKEHCYYGYKMLRKIPLLSEAAEIAYSHHEHYDGSGYPRGLTDQQIPLGARIVAIANTLDSITNDLPYRAKRSLKAARAEILRCAGTQFDPHIVDVFLELPDALWFELRKQCDSRTDD